MNSTDKIGRNDPCPCGSGKKYKKCCEATLPTGLSRNQTESSIRFNREIAYSGKVGRRREEFCRRFLKHKRKLLEVISETQKEQTAKRGQMISCRKGCSFCCNELVEASLGECELIVFYLYQHEEIMNIFIRAFPLWFVQVQKHPDIFRRVENAQKKSFASGLSKDSLQLLGNELQSYWELQIPCPFLVEQICSIYEVRPWACSSVFSVSPSEWCDPLNKQNPKVYWTMMPHDIQIPFYDKEAIRAFVEYYNYWRYHEGLGNVTPYDMYTGKHLEIIQRRKEAKSRTLQVRKDCNRVVREQDNGF